MPLFVIRSICQTKTVSLPDFTEPILKAKKAHFGLLSLGRALVKEEERKAKEKGSSWVHLSVELDLAFVLEGRCFYYMVITGYLISESILLSLLHVWGTEWESRSKVKSVTISRHQISTSTLRLKERKIHKGQYSTETQIAAHEASKPQPAGRAWQVPTAMGRSCSCSFPSATGLQILMRTGCWDRWTLVWLHMTILTLVLYSWFLKVCSHKRYTFNLLFQRVNTQIRRNRWYFIQHCQPWAAYTPGWQNKRKIWKWQGRERKFILQIFDRVANLFFKVCFHNW